MSHATDISAVSMGDTTPRMPAEDQDLISVTQQDDIPSTQPRNEAFYMGTPPQPTQSPQPQDQLHLQTESNQSSMPFPMSAPPQIPTSQSMDIDRSKRRLQTSSTPANEATASQDVLSPTQPFVPTRLSPEEKRLRQMDSISPDEIPGRPSSSRATARERMLEAQLMQAQKDNQLLREQRSEDIETAQAAYGKIKTTVKEREMQFKSAVSQARMQVSEAMQAQDDAHQVQMAQMSMKHQQQEQAVTAQARTAIMQTRLDAQRETLSHEDKQAQLKAQAQEAIQSTEVQYRTQLQQLERDAQQRLLEKDLEMAEMQRKFQEAQTASTQQQQSKEDRYNQLIEQSKEVVSLTNKEKQEMQMQIDQLEQARKQQEAQSAQLNAIVQRQHEARQAEETQRLEMVQEIEKLKQEKDIYRQEKEYYERCSKEKKEEPSLVQPPITEDKAPDPWWSTSQPGYSQDPWSRTEAFKGGKGKGKPWQPTLKGSTAGDDKDKTPLTQMIEEELDNEDDLKTPPNEKDQWQEYGKGRFPVGWNDPTKLGDFRSRKPPGSPGSTASSDERFKKKPWDPPDSDKLPGQQLPPIPETTTSEESNSLSHPKET